MPLPRLCLAVLLSAQYSIGKCPANCSGHGECGGDGHCRCDEGFAGVACARAVPACANSCSGHGACVGGGRCVCDVGFMGQDCSRRISMCNYGCSGNGLCGPQGECICEPGFTGRACEHVQVVLQPSSPTPPPRPPPSAVPTLTLVPSRSTLRFTPSPSLCPAACSGHGSCVRGRCHCHTGFAGLDCGTVVPRCKSNCSGHGICELIVFSAEEPRPALTGGDPIAALQPRVIGSQCRCLGGFTGADCATAIGAHCPLGCSAHGQCTEHGCECHDGLAPPACAFSSGSRLARVAAAVAQVTDDGTLRGSGGTPCPYGCSGRGQCRGTGRCE